MHTWYDVPCSVIRILSKYVTPGTAASVVTRVNVYGLCVYCFTAAVFTAAVRVYMYFEMKWYVYIISYTPEYFEVLRALYFVPNQTPDINCCSSKDVLASLKKKKVCGLCVGHQYSYIFRLYCCLRKAGAPAGGQSEGRSQEFFSTHLFCRSAVLFFYYSYLFIAGKFNPPSSPLSPTLQITNYEGFYHLIPCVRITRYANFEANNKNRSTYDM